MYTLKILSSKDFDNLPRSETRGSNVSNSLGFANPFKKVAYIRQTAWPELNQYLFDHELEHLIEKHKTDTDENGICHKKGGFFRNLFTFIDPLNTLGTRGGHPFAGAGNAITSGLEGLVGGPIGGVLGTIAGGSKNFGKLGPGGSIPSQQNMGQQSPTGFGNLFPSSNIQSFGQGFGQIGAPSSGGIGPQGGAGAPMANIGLGAGIPNQANISMGQGSQGNQDQQRQSGFWFPSYKF